MKTIFIILLMIISGSINAQRIQISGQKACYLLIDGYRHWITDHNAYFKLFKNWNGINQISSSEMNAIPVGSNITAKTFLGRADNTLETYIIFEGKSKRWIKSESEFNRFGFDWGKIQIKNSSYINNINTVSSLGSDGSKYNNQTDNQPFKTDADKSAIEILKKYLEKSSRNNDEIKKVYTDEDGNLRTDDIDGNFLSIYGLSDAEIFNGDLNSDGKPETIIVITNSGGGGGGNVETTENYLISNNEVISEIDEELINAPKNEYGYNIYLKGIENGFVNIYLIHRNENDGFYSQGREEKLKCKLINNKLKVEN